MIRTVRGMIVERGMTWALVETKAGVGYQVFTSRRGLELSSSTEIVMYTHMVVRENLIALYGFPTADEVELFERLLTVSGVGPKSALSILDLGPLDDLRGAIGGANASYLSTAKGIGKKTAGKVVLELQGKYDWSAGGMASVSGSVAAEVNEALLSLGYQNTQIREVLLRIDATLPASEQIRQALRMIGQTKFD